MSNAKARKPGLVGSFFHSIDDKGALEWQGRVVERLAAGLYLVELFSWVDGRPNKRLIAALDARLHPGTWASMLGWAFYPSAEDMNAAHKAFEYSRRAAERAAAGTKTGQGFGLTD